MTKELDTTFIQIVHPVCCGLDVHKKKISACLIKGVEKYYLAICYIYNIFRLLSLITTKNCIRA